MWGEIEKKRIFAEEAAKWQKQNEILNADPPRQSPENLSGMAFNIGLTPEEMYQKISADLPGFRRIYNIAVNQCLDWDQAEVIYNQNLAAKESLTDRVGQSLESRFPRPPKPGRLYKEFHKRRKKQTKTQLVKRATDYLNWKKAADAINTEEAIPLDEM